MQRIEDLDETGGGANTTGRRNIEEDSWGCEKRQKSVILTDGMETHMEGNRERSALRAVRKGDALTWSPRSNPKDYAGTPPSWAAPLV